MARHPPGLPATGGPATLQLLFPLGRGRPHSLLRDHRAEPFILHHIRDGEITDGLMAYPIIVLEAGRLIPRKQSGGKLKDDIAFCPALWVNFGHREGLVGRFGFPS